MWNEKTFECDEEGYKRAMLPWCRMLNLGGLTCSSRNQAPQLDLWHCHFRYMIQLTPSAVTKIKELVGTQSASRDFGLRLDVEKGGCAGFQYIMKIMERVAGDQIVEQDGVRVFVSEGGKPYLSGCTLDFVDSLSDGGFRVENPNATRSCGCGTSFEPKGNVTK